MIEIQDIIYKHFKEERTRFFDGTDSYREFVEGETFIRYEYYQGRKDRILIWLGSTRFDEAPLKICYTAKQLDDLITSIIY